MGGWVAMLYYRGGVWYNGPAAEEDRDTLAERLDGTGLIDSG